MMWPEALGLSDILVKIIATVIVALLASAGTWLFTRYRRYSTMAKRLAQAETAVSPESKGIWITPSIPKRPPADYGFRHRASIPIWVVANLKGGVGKTTTAVNLFAHYAQTKGPTLFIDLDFQGSGTSMALGPDEYATFLNEQGNGSLGCKASRLVGGETGAWLCSAAQPIAAVGGGRVIPAHYTLANAETRAQVEWLIGACQDDVRYRLAAILQSDEVQRTFRHVIIDAPPRLTTACVQAFAAATHVLIPTVLDRMSAVAVGTFADQLRINQSIWPHLRILGVLGTMTRTGTGLSDDEKQAMLLARDTLVLALQTAEQPLRGASVIDASLCIPERQELSRSAGSGIAYASSSRARPAQEIRDHFANLAKELDRRGQDRS